MKVSVPNTMPLTNLLIKAGQELGLTISDPNGETMEGEHFNARPNNNYCRMMRENGILISSLRGNELADTLAKQGAHLEQIDSTTTYSEEKTIIKSCLKRKWKLEHPKYNKADAYNQLERHEQVVLFRLRTNHNKLK